jgi:hypothetical protein
VFDKLVLRSAENAFDSSKNFLLAGGVKRSPPSMIKTLHVEHLALPPQA